MWMAEGRSRESWGHTSAILAMIHNAIPGMKKADMKSPSDFNPFEHAAAKRDELLEIPFDALKILVPGPGGKPV